MTQQEVIDALSAILAAPKGRRMQMVKELEKTESPLVIHLVVQKYEQLGIAA